MEIGNYVNGLKRHCCVFGCNFSCAPYSYTCNLVISATLYSFSVQSSAILKQISFLWEWSSLIGWKENSSICWKQICCLRSESHCTTMAHGGDIPEVKYECRYIDLKWGEGCQSLGPRVTYSEICWWRDGAKTWREHVCTHPHLSNPCKKIIGGGGC